MAYVKLVKNIFKDGSWQKSKWTKKQFTKFIEFLLTMNATAVDIQNYDSTTLQIIA